MRSTPARVVRLFARAVGNLGPWRAATRRLPNHHVATMWCRYAARVSDTKALFRNPGSAGVSPASILLSGNVEAVDKMLTFLGVGFLSALSDVKGRKALMAWSALGFGLTCLIQATTRSVGMLYVADLIDGISSCMYPVCMAFVTDASPADKRVVNLGIFQGLSIGGAFILAFPIGGILGKQLGPRVPVLLGAAVQLLNLLLILFVTPESNTRAMRAGRTLDLREANPLGALRKLFNPNPSHRPLTLTLTLPTDH